MVERDAVMLTELSAKLTLTVEGVDMWPWRSAEVWGISFRGKDAYPKGS